MELFEKVRTGLLILLLYFIVIGAKSQCQVDPAFVVLDQFCDSIELKNTSTNLNLIDSLHWDFGDGSNFVYIDTPAWDETITHTYENTGDYKVELTIFTVDGLGDPCITTTSQTITYNYPTAAYNYVKACFNELTSFSNISTPPDSITSFDWFLDDIYYSSNQNIDITFTTNGDYKITLVAENFHQCTDTNNKIVSYKLPELGFITDTVCFGEATLFTDTSLNAFNIASRVWEYNNNTIGTLPSFSYNMPDAGEALQVKLKTTSTSPAGCLDSITKPIKVAQLPHAIYDSIAGCFYNELEFIDLSESEFDPITEVLWDFDDGGATANTSPAYHTFSNTDLYNVSLTVTTEFGCSDDTTNIIPVDQPTANFTFDDVCEGDTMFFDETSTSTTFTELVSWNWDFGDGNSVTAILGDTNHVYTDPNANPGYDVELIVESSMGCFDTIYQTVFVDTIPIAGFDYDPGCIGQTVCLHDTSISGDINTSIVAWEWTFAGEPLASISDPCFNIDTIPGWYHVTLKVQNSNGCWSEELLDSIYMSHPPTADFEATSFCFDDTTFFTNTTDTAGLSGTTWLWTFGEPYLGSADTSYLENPWHIYTMDGDFNVTLEATSIYGCTSVATQQITIEPLPIPDFIIPDTVAVGAPNVFYDNSTHPQGLPIYQWYWEFGDGGTSTNQDPTYTYNTPGLDTICLTVFSGCYNTICDTILILDCSNPEFYYISDSLFFTDFFDNTEPVGNIISWFWDFGDDSTLEDTSSLQNPSWQYPQEGWYQVYLQTEDKYGCISDTTINVYAGNSVSADFSVFGVCEGEITGFVDWSHSPVDSTYAFWHWDFGDGSDTTIYEKTDTLYHQYLLPYTYPVVLTVYDTVYGEPVQDSKSMDVTVYYAPEAGINVSSVGECLGVPINFYDISDSEDEITIWTWDFGDGYFSDIKNPVHEYDTTGVYNVILEIETSNGCTDTTEIEIAMSHTPNVEFEIVNPCVNSATQFKPIYGSDTLKITQWLWDFGDHLDTANTSVDSMPIHYYNRVDIYTVKVRMWAYDCKGEYEETFIIKPIPYSQFSVIENYQGVQGKTKFINESIYATGYEWDFGNGNITTVPDPIEIYELDSTYLISLAAINEYGCADTAFYELDVFFKGLYFPNAFMPNAPNPDISLFTPKGINLREYHAQVFDLRGNLMWESELLDEHGSPVESWDGYTNDILMPNGMYIWKAVGIFKDGSAWKGQSLDGEAVKPNGVVTLIR